jgi:preprotein translocase subunit SecY
MNKQLTNRFFVVLVNIFAFRVLAYIIVYGIYMNTVLKTLGTFNMLGAAK